MTPSADFTNSLLKIDTIHPMDFDEPDNREDKARYDLLAGEPSSLSSSYGHSGPLDNILQLFNLKKPVLRLVKTINSTTAKIIPFKGPLTLIVCGFTLSIYALI